MFVVMAIVAMTIIAGCNTNAPTVTQSSQFPPCIESDCNCSDFTSQPEAQAVLEAFEGDPHGLDRDGNGKACESLPGQSSTTDRQSPVIDSQNIHLRFGNPSRANTEDINNYLLLKPQYAVGYDCSKNLAIWVSGQLTSDWLGNVPRSDDFRPDPDLPCYQVHPRDYRGSGYERGHIVASADRDATPEDNSATYLMSNMMPQAPQNNRGVWRQFEEHLRDLVEQGKELYVIAGGEGEKGTIGNGVTVPAFTWKVALILNNGTPESMLAVRMPNDETVAGTDWEDHRVTVDMVEVATDLNFFSELQNRVEEDLEARN